MFDEHILKSSASLDNHWLICTFHKLNGNCLRFKRGNIVWNLVERKIRASFAIPEGCHRDMNNNGVLFWILYIFIKDSASVEWPRRILFSHLQNMPGKLFSNWQSLEGHNPNNYRI